MGCQTPWPQWLRLYKWISAPFVCHPGASFRLRRLPLRASGLDISSVATHSSQKTATKQASRNEPGCDSIDYLTHSHGKRPVNPLMHFQKREANGWTSTSCRIGRLKDLKIVPLPNCRSGPRLAGPLLHWFINSLLENPLRTLRLLRLIILQFVKTTAESNLCSSAQSVVKKAQPNRDFVSDC